MSKGNTGKDFFEQMMQDGTTYDFQKEAQLQQAKECLELARKMAMLKGAYVMAQFTEEQAFELVKIHLEGSLR